MKISGFFILLVTVLAIAACDRASPIEGRVGTPPLKIGGAWTYKFDVIDQSGLATCQTHDGTLNINPTGAGDSFNGNVRGVFACMLSGDSTGDFAIAAVTSGELTGESVRFIAYGCVHLGALSGSPPDHASGIVLDCSLGPAPDYPTRPFTGTWEASR
jgi:hypothetical protein